MREDIELTCEDGKSRATICLIKDKDTEEKYMAWTDGGCYLRGKTRKELVKEISKTIMSINERHKREISGWDKAKKMVNGTKNFKDLDRIYEQSR